MTYRRSEGHTSGCDWCISIRSVDNTQDWRKFWKRFRACFVFQSRVSNVTSSFDKLSLQMHMFSVHTETRSRRFQISPSGLKRRFHSKAPFSWRISVDGTLNRRNKLNLERLTVQLGLTVIYFPIYRQSLTYSEEVRNIAKYITVNPSFFKPLHLLITSYQVPALLICPLALAKVSSIEIKLCLQTSP